MDAPAIRILRNELRSEPRVETHPAARWLEETSPRMGWAATRPMREYTSILSLEVRQPMPQPALLCVDVGTDVTTAIVSLTLTSATWRQTDVAWKESRIWLIVDEPRLLAGDRIEITVSSDELIAPAARVRMGNLSQQISQFRASA
jgi:hypothetical protein